MLSSAKRILFTIGFSPSLPRLRIASRGPGFKYRVTPFELGPSLAESPFHTQAQALRAAGVRAISLIYRLSVGAVNKRRAAIQRAPVERRPGWSLSQGRMLAQKHTRVS